MRARRGEDGQEIGVDAGDGMYVLRDNVHIGLDHDVEDEEDGFRISFEQFRDQAMRGID